MTSHEPFATRIHHSEVLLGAVVQLPGDDLLPAVTAAGFQFLVVDLIDGPFDEVLLRRLVRTAKGAGLGVVAIADGSIAHARLDASGVDGLVASPGNLLRLRQGVEVSLAIVGDAREARRSIADGSHLVALDVSGALAAMLEAFPSAASASVTTETLVLLPGMLADGRVFDGIITALPANVSCRPVRIDLDDSVHEMAESVLAVAPHRFALAGHSLGGIVALEIWRCAPTRVTRLALLNTSARPPSDAQLSAWTELHNRTEAGEFSAVIEEQAEVNVGSSGGRELVAQCIEMAAKVGPDGFLRQLRAQKSRTDSRPSLAGITVPTVVISGCDDAVCPPDLQRELAAGIPDSCHVTVEGAGHMTSLDHPGEVAAHLAAWLTV